VRRFACIPDTVGRNLEDLFLAASLEVVYEFFAGERRGVVT
jgi:hypothetical protein